MFQQRNKYYNKLQNIGLILKHTEFLLRFEEDRFYLGNTSNPYPICILDIDLKIEAYRNGIIWKIRVLRYDENQNTLFAEILDYNIASGKMVKQLDLSFLALDHLKFRTVDTGALLQSVVLKRNTTTADNSQKEELSIIEESWTINKTIKVPFNKIRFGNGIVSIPYHLIEIRQDIVLEIQNPSVRPEFEAIKDYFIKALKQKAIIVNLFLKHNGTKLISYDAHSEQIDAIDEKIIGTMRFEFVKKKFIKFKPQDNEKTIHTLESLVAQIGENANSLISDENSIMNEILKIETAKHYLQLKYLAPLHSTNILKLRFVLQPFSFIFLLTGEKNYYVIWETMDTEEATYIWQIDKSIESLKTAMNEIELSLTEMKKTGRHNYLKNAPAHFSKIVHDYSDVKKGFISWKGMLEERLV
jgi:hypothetical protein